MAREAPAGLRGGLLVFELTSQERVVAEDDVILGRGDECARRAASLVLPGVAGQPAVEELLAAAEAGDVVPGRVVVLGAREPGAHARSRRPRKRATVSSSRSSSASRKRRASASLSAICRWSVRT